MLTISAVFTHRMNFLFSHSKLSHMTRSLLQPSWFAAEGLLLEPAQLLLAQGNHWSGHSLKVTRYSALILPIADDAVLRNIFSAGISVWSCHASSRHLPFSSVWSCHASRDTRLWAADPLQNKGYGSLWQPGDGTLRGTAGAEDLRLCFPETLGGIKSQWFLCLGPLLGGT